MFASYGLVCGDALGIDGFCLIARAPAAVKHFRQNLIEVHRITDKGNVAVSVDHERGRNHDRKAGLHPKLVHCPCVVEGDPIAQIRALFGQPRVQLGSGLNGRWSVFMRRDCDDLNSAVLISLLQLHQMVHRVHTWLAPRCPKFDDVHFAGLKARQGLATQPGFHLNRRSRGLHLQYHADLQSYCQRMRDFMEEVIARFARLRAVTSLSVAAAQSAKAVPARSAPQ
ncbi:hypothetical protein MES5069_310066 [Mesorhizobium escarrei]|uniref:Uncharacterized protein n=1 Tax=Mesorhizobium escarrei TaxID=666018 RepID=A0ABM9DZV2_9HYPH|nr:hypothetical protein MES5069_310066 [Mesorhizobium escarrei]